MDASDVIKSMQRRSCKEGAVHIWGPYADRHAKLLISQAVEGSFLAAYLHSQFIPYEQPCQRPQDAVELQLSATLDDSVWPILRTANKAFPSKPKLLVR
jgi:hypothetical protein